MVHSRDLAALRRDVRGNCEVFLALCREAGLPVLVTETVRDEEYQRYLAAKGYAAKGATRPTFHSVKAGLAFDICKNVRGHEYDDASFFARCGEIGKRVGFSWGGDWRSFPDKPHFQWDDGGRYTGSMILAGRYPPEMKAYEEDEMTQEKFNELMENYLKDLARQAGSAWSAEAREWAEKAGLLVGDAEGNGQYRSFVTREQLAVVLKRFADGAR